MATAGKGGTQSFIVHAYSASLNCQAKAKSPSVMYCKAHHSLFCMLRIVYSK